MKIVSVEAFAVRAKPIDEKGYWGARAWGQAAQTQHISAEYPPKQRRTFIYSDRIEAVIVRITTDDGIVGWGEAKAPVAAVATKQIVDTLLAPVLIGADPRDTTLLWERMYAGMRVRGHQAGFFLEAISGVDIALWDIAGKVAGQPIYQLLGGAFRNPVRVYASGIPALAGGASDEAYADTVEQALALKADGHSAIKLAFGRDIVGDIKTARLLRDALGADFDLFADAAGSYDVGQALRIGHALEELDFGFFEMPIPPEDKEGYARIAAHLSIPIALDSLMTRFETLDFLRREGLQLVQPDVCRAGGITECQRIAALADAINVSSSQHVSTGTAL